MLVFLAGKAHCLNHIWLTSILASSATFGKKKLKLNPESREYFLWGGWVAQWPEPAGPTRIRMALGGGGAGAAFTFSAHNVD